MKKSEYDALPAVRWDEESPIFDETEDIDLTSLASFLERRSGQKPVRELLGEMQLHPARKMVPREIDWYRFVEQVTGLCEGEGEEVWEHFADVWPGIAEAYGALNTAIEAAGRDQQRWFWEADPTRRLEFADEHVEEIEEEIASIRRARDR